MSEANTDLKSEGNAHLLGSRARFLDAKDREQDRWLGCGPSFWIAAGGPPSTLATVFWFFVRVVAVARFGVA